MEEKEEKMTLGYDFAEIKESLVQNSTYEHLTKILHTILVYKPEKPLDSFEHLSRLVKETDNSLERKQWTTKTVVSEEETENLTKLQWLYLDTIDSSDEGKNEETMQEVKTESLMPRLQHVTHKFKAIGIQFNSFDLVKLAAGLSSKENLRELSFFGLIRTLRDPYFVLTCRKVEMNEEGEAANATEIFLVSNAPEGPWSEILNPTSENILVARLCTKLLKGNLDAYMEKDLLSARLAFIHSRCVKATEIIPEDGEAEEASEFRFTYKGLKFDEETGNIVTEVKPTGDEEGGENASKGEKENVIEEYNEQDWVPIRVPLKKLNGDTTTSFLQSKVFPGLYLMKRENERLNFYSGFGNVSDLNNTEHETRNKLPKMNFVNNTLIISEETEDITEQTQNSGQEEEEHEE
eukprot:augustus_masked-scaffold_7-processed-gene-1.52-mRNA-1 protein AED:1.00 eAED:1.00 QI:0/-1/0/0/-1/1/1/0/406